MLLFTEHEAALAAVAPDPCRWIKRIVNYRNDLTHQPLVEEKEAFDQIDLLGCNFVLRTLLELCFLKPMAIEGKDAENLASRCVRYHQIKERFFSDQE